MHIYATPININRTMFFNYFYLTKKKLREKIFLLCSSFHFNFPLYKQFLSVHARFQVLRTEVLRSHAMILSCILEKAKGATSRSFGPWGRRVPCWFCLWEPSMFGIRRGNGACTSNIFGKNFK